MGVKEIREKHSILRHVYEVTNRSWLYVGSTMAALGAMMIIQAAVQAKRIIGDMSFLGPVFLKMFLREYGPVIVSVLLATRYGASSAAQLALLRLTEQLDAYVLHGMPVRRMFVWPRVWAGVIGFLPITVWGIASAFGVSALVAHHYYDVPWYVYFNLREIVLLDVILCVFKSVLFGAAVPWVACACALRSSDTRCDVGSATTNAVVYGSLAVFVLNCIVGIALGLCA